MGVLSETDLAALIERHGLRYFVEFGVGKGEDIVFAADFPFEHLYSIEGSHKLAIEGAFRHSSNQRMSFIHGKGERGWRQVSFEIPADAPVLFLLDEAQAENDRAAIAASRDMGRDIVLLRPAAEV